MLVRQLAFELGRRRSNSHPDASRYREFCRRQYHGEYRGPRDSSAGGGGVEQRRQGRRRHPGERVGRQGSSPNNPLHCDERASTHGNARQGCCSPRLPPQRRQSPDARTAHNCNQQQHGCSQRHQMSVRRLPGLAASLRFPPMRVGRSVGAHRHVRDGIDHSVGAHTASELQVCARQMSQSTSVDGRAQAQGRGPRQ
jgi:hypothetical protein